jgi:hypothetical protein
MLVFRLRVCAGPFLLALTSSVCLRLYGVYTPNFDLSLIVPSLTHSQRYCALSGWFGCSARTPFLQSGRARGSSGIPVTIFCLRNAVVDWLFLNKRIGVSKSNLVAV